jgi:hypothetical protein
MSEVVSSKPSKAGKRWLHLSTRILVGVIMFIVVVGFIFNVAELVGVWVVRASAYSAVTDVTSTMSQASAAPKIGGIARLTHQRNSGEKSRGEQA